ncbi:hypothetical protein LguiB_010278 [Lonicera macranthoides]
MRVIEFVKGIERRGGSHRSLILVVALETGVGRFPEEIICTNESSVLKYYCVKVYNGYEDPTTEKLSPMPIRTIFFPIWLFHTVVARGRFSLPAPAVPYNRHDTSKFTKAYTREDRRLRASHLQVRVQENSLWVTFRPFVAHFPKHLKFFSYRAKFDVDPQSKKKVLQSMAKSWRAFKNLLTRDYIYRFQYMPELLQHPPEVYKKYIDQSTWDEFVNQRLSNSFKKEAIPPVAIEDRAVMWLKGRETKDGVIVDDEIKEVAEKMATIRSQVEDGSVVIEGSSDILSMALGSSESAGHVRGIGFGVTPTAYFDLPRRGSKRYIKELESRLQEEREKRKNAEQMLSKYLDKEKHSNEFPTKQSSETVTSNTQKSDNKKTLVSNEIKVAGGDQRGCESYIVTKGIIMALEFLRSITFGTKGKLHSRRRFTRFSVTELQACTLGCSQPSIKSHKMSN